MRLTRAAALLVAAVVCAAPAVAATTRVSLKMTGGYAVRVIRACGEKSSHHYTLYRRGRQLGFSGRVTPAPRAGSTIKLKLKKCRGGNDFRTVREKTVRIGANGRFSGAIAGSGRGDYWLRATYGRTKSKKEQFRVP